MKFMRWTLALAFAGVLVVTLSACGGGGGGGDGPVVSPQPTTRYGGMSYAIDANCSFAVGNIVTLSSSASDAESGARRGCISLAQSLAAGGRTPTCSSNSFPQCAAIGVGRNSAGRCNLRGHVRSSASAARSAAIQHCQSELGSSANCEVLASACASGGPDGGTWRPPSGGGGGNGGGGVDRGQVGNEYGTTSTSGRNWNLTCSSDVVFSNSGNVVLPSVEVVALPSEAGTVTLEYDSISIPDRFVVVLGGRVVIDTQYVGHENTVQGVNAVLTRYGFTPTSQARIISPGSGSRSFSKAAGVRSTVVRVYAPLEGTAWDVTLKFAGSSCPSGGGNGGGTPTNGAPQAAAAARTLSGGVGSSWTWTRAQLESAFRDPDGDQLTYTIGSSRPTVASSNVPSGGGMEINANSPGTAVISVTARDPGGLTATWRITVTVNQAAQQRYYGAISTDLENTTCQQKPAGVAWNASTEASAVSTATNGCVQRGGTRNGCAAHITKFGSAYQGNHQCGALAFGESQSSCGFRTGTGGTVSAAEQNALSRCRSQFSSCSLETSGGGRFARCTD